jgi:hypothetical protein
VRRLSALAGLLVVLLTGCGSHAGSSAGPQLVTLGHNSQNVAMGNGRVKPGVKTSFGGMVLCLDRTGSVTVTGAEPVNPTGGIRIDQYGVRPSPFWKGGTGIGVQAGDLAHNGFKAGRKVNVTCDPKTGRGYELAITVAMPDTTEAKMTGVKVDYTSAGQQKSVIFPITLFLCPHVIQGNGTGCHDTAA